MKQFRLFSLMAGLVLASMVLAACASQQNGNVQPDNSAEQQQYTPEKYFNVKKINGGKEIEITKYKGKDERVNIPPSIKGLPVTGIGESAYKNCASLTSITIPHSVTVIGEYAFSGCTNLTNITIPNSITSIEYSAFRDCTSLTSVTIPNSVIKIDRYAFSDCTSLTSVTIPNSVTNIGDGAFGNCTSLASVIIPNSVTEIDTYAFSGCISLTSVTIPDSVTNIGDGAFLPYRTALPALTLRLFKSAPTLPV